MEPRTANRDGGILWTWWITGMVVCWSAALVLSEQRTEPVQPTESQTAYHYRHGQLEAESVVAIGRGAEPGVVGRANGPQIGGIPKTFANPILPGFYPAPSI